MAKRRHFIAELNKDGKTISTAEAFAWNSAARASEQLVRAYAILSREAFTGDRPDVYGKPGGDGAVYNRVWTGDKSGTVLRVRMVEVF